MNVIDFTLFGMPCHQIGSHSVDRSRAETAADRYDGKMIVQPQLCPGLLFVDTDKTVADRVADHLEPLCVRDARLSLLKREKDCLGAGGKHLGGHAGIGVLFMQKDRYPHLFRLADDRAGDITAGTDCKIRLKLLDNLFSAMPRPRQPDGSLDIVRDIPRQKTAVKSSDMDVGDRIPLFGDHRVLHIARNRRKQKLRARIDFRQFTRDGDRRVDMPAGAAARQKYSHR